MVAITKQLVSSRAFVSEGRNPCTFITVHQTGNTTAGANAKAHANLQSRGNARGASWHFQVDDKKIYQSFLESLRCWHAGDGTGAGNFSSIAIEICVNSDGDYVKALKRAAKLVKYLMKKHGIPLKNVVQHNNWSGKNCPAQIRAGQSGITWADFKGLVSGSKASKKKAKDTSKSSKKTAKKNKKAAKLKVDGWWGAATTRRGQQLAGTVDDGEIWNQNVQWKSQNPGLTSGWKWVATARAKSSPFILAHQTILKKRGYYKGKLDGIAGPQYFSAVQRDMGTVVDGSIWKKSPAVKRWQRRMNKGKI